MMGKVKINLGSGHWKLEDWVNVDIDRESQPDVCANLAGGLPFANGVARLMHTEDFIDQLELEQAAEFLRECHRILIPGGVLRVLTPDMRKLAQLYLDDPQLFESYDRFTRWQLDYMLPFFSDLLEPEGYAEAVDFIVSDLAGVGVSERDREIERATPVIVRSLPAYPLETAAAAVELNARVLEINLGICRELLVDDELPPVISEQDYFIACRRVSSYEECMGLVALAVELGDTLKTLVRIPFISALLRTMRRPAHAAGFGALQEFLETGFVTFHRIADIDRFLGLLNERMDRVFDHIYHAPIEPE